LDATDLTAIGAIDFVLRSQAPVVRIVSAALVESTVSKRSAIGVESVAITHNAIRGVVEPRVAAIETVDEPLLISIDPVGRAR
jgi:hypothetical protein